MHILDHFLMHYGVKGMKWGVRKQKGSGSSGGKTAIPKSRAEVMSDAQLKAVNKRLNMEREYKRMMAERALEERSLLQKGIAQVGDSLQRAAKQQVDQYVQQRVSGLVKELRNAGKPVTVLRVPKA